MEEEWINDDDVIIKRRASHIRSCCADGCTSKGYRLLIEGERVQYFPFPLYDQDLCQRWAAAVKLQGDASFEKSYVCSKHFRATDYKSRLHDDYKRSLRRTAIPSLEPVVQLGKTPKKERKIVTAGSSDYSTEDDEEYEYDDSNILSLMAKDTLEGDSLNVFTVKKSAETGANEDDDKIDKPPVLKEHKKALLLCQNLLAAGEPYPWKKDNMETWINERMVNHVEHLEKIRENIKTEEMKINLLQEQVTARKEILAMVIIKKTMGRMGLSQYLRSINH